MANKIWDEDITIDILKEKTIAVIGYGNQGRSQALNLRDSGMKVIIGNPRDSYLSQAEADSQEVYPIIEAVKQADVVMILLPDEVQANVFNESIRDYLKDGAALSFAHGFNVHFKKFEVPSNIDVIMVAPRMIGEGLRIWYEKGTGFCSFVAVEQDYTGQAQEIVLALAKGIGGASPAMFTTFEEEAVIDLFGEQVGGGGALVGTLTQFETLLEAGFDPEIIQIEMYGSGELIEVQRSITEMGLVEALSLHSPTSQYGQMKRRKQFTSQAMKDLYKSVLSEIKSGTFAEEWAKEQESGYKNMEQMRAELNSHPIIEAEKANIDVRDHMFTKQRK